MAVTGPSSDPAATGRVVLRWLAAGSCDEQHDRVMNERPEPTAEGTGGSPPAGLRIPVGAPGRRPDAERPGPVGDATGDTAQVASVHRSVGGQPFFDDLVGRFYDHVRHDPVLLSLYPDQEHLEPAAERLSLFLAQYWGGPGTYSERRGHPRLRMRHAPYRIDERARDHWLAAMLDALDRTMAELDRDALGLSEDDVRVLDERFRSYFEQAANHLVNSES